MAVLADEGGDLVWLAGSSTAREGAGDEVGTGDDLGTAVRAFLTGISSSSSEEEEGEMARFDGAAPCGGVGGEIRLASAAAASMARSRAMQSSVDGPSARLLADASANENKNDEACQGLYATQGGRWSLTIGVLPRLFPFRHDPVL